jgi:predicted permease
MPRRFRFPWLSDRQIAGEVEEELAFHLDHTAADLQADGWPESIAREEARRRFGDLEFTRAYCRTQDRRREQEKRRMTLLDELRQDLRYAVRSLSGSPGFAAAAIFTLALGIGANTAIFSAVRGVLLDPLPFRDADRIVRVYHANPANGIARGALSEPDFLDWRRAATRAESIAGYFFADGLSGLDLTDAGHPERISAALVTDGFFETLGVAPLLGRTLNAEDQIAGRNRAVVLGHGLWTRRFGADATLIGRTVTMNGEPFEVVGVMPRGFTYPAAQSLDAWVPLSFFGPNQIGRVRGAHFLGAIARLAPGATEAQLRSELSGLAERLSREYPDNPGWTSANTAPIRESIVGEVRGPLTVLMASVALLLLMACVNIASLLLARASGRRTELAVRAALGAGRGRIARQLLTESLTLALLGGALGVGLGVVAVRAFASWGATQLPRAATIRVDGTVLAFTLGLSVLAGILFGLLPALRASSGLEQTLRAGSRGTVSGVGQRLRTALVVVEVSLAVILVTGAALAAKSLSRLVGVDPGFRTEQALVVTLSIPPRYFATPDGARHYYQSVLDQIAAVPGVQAVGAIRDLPLRGRGEMVRPGVAGRPVPAGGNPAAQYHHVSAGYFQAMGIPLRAGRTFEPTDRAGAPPVLIVNEEFARRTWPGENAAGKALRFGQREIPVVGVVGDVRQSALNEPVEPAIYIHALQELRSRMSVVVRTAGDPMALADSVRQAIWAQDPNQTITGLTTLEDVMGTAIARPRLIAWLLGSFGAIGLTLGALGIFGVLAYSVAQRQREIGVRMALGATAGGVIRLIVGRGMLLAALGVALGVIGAALLTSSMQSVLFGIEPSDPATFAQVVLVLMAAAGLASWLPARRALSIDPVSALRAE